MKPVKNHQHCVTRPSYLSLVLALAGLAVSAAAAQGQLWNINFAGRNETNEYVLVTDGTDPIGVGGGVWNNVMSPTSSSTWDPSSPISILEADGGTAIHLDWGPNGSLRDLDASLTGVALTDLNRGWFGYSGFDQTLNFTDIPAGTYDLTVYFTWKWNENSVDYQITQGSGSDLGPRTLVPEQDTADSYASFVEGSNYIVFQDVSPVGGNLDLRIFNTSDAGISAIQISAPQPTLTAVVNSVTGMTVLKNLSDEAVSLDYYLIQSSAGALDETTWNSMDDQEPGTVGWVEAGGSDDSQLAELNLTSSLWLDPQESVGLGYAFDTSVFGSGNDGDLTFRYGIPGSSALAYGDVIYVTEVSLPGDLDGDGFVGLDDLDLILNNWNQSVPPGVALADPSGDGFVGLDDLDIVLNHWNTGTAPASAASSIPEPASLVLLSGLGIWVGLSRRFHKRYVVRSSATTAACVVGLMLLGVSSVQASTTGYVYAYFQGGWPTGGHSGVYMSYSEDGLHFEPMNDGNAVYVPPDAWGNDWSTDDEDQARDPSVVYGPDGLYHMVWTSGITTRSIGYASSPDLLNWSNEQLIDIWDESTVVDNTWAPEVFYDETNSQYQIIFASDLNNGDHKLYSITTTDFVNYSSPSLYYYNGVTVIDAMIAYDNVNSQYLMAVKDEQNGQKNIHLATSASAQGPWTTNNPIIVGPGSGIEENAAEGPSLLKIDDTWYLYYDAYGAGYLGVATTTDPDPTNAGSWVNMTSQATLPSGHHGTVFAAPISAIAFEFLPYSRSDLNGDEAISMSDWLIFTANHLVDLSGMTTEQQAALGDLNGDGFNNFVDFRLFQSDYDALNGQGAFVSMLATVPEPSAGLALGLAMLLASVGRRRG